MPFKLDPPPQKGRFVLDAPPAPEQSIMDRAESAFQSIPGASVASEFAAGANRTITNAIDALGPDAVNYVLRQLGVDYQIPTAGGMIDTRGGYMEPGLARNVVAAAGETVPVAVGSGMAMRALAGQVPATAQSTAANVMRALGSQGTVAGDALGGALTATGAEIGDRLGGETGRAIGSFLVPVIGTAAFDSAISGIRNAKTKSLVVRAAPTIERLSRNAKAHYEKIDSLGITVDSDSLKTFANGLAAVLKKEGLDPDLTPGSVAVLSRILKDSDNPLTLSEIDTLRKVAQGAAQNFNNKADSRLGSIIIDKIDDFLDNLPVTSLNNPTGENIGLIYRQARDNVARVKRAEIIAEAVYKAQNQASGFENGLRTQFRALLNNKRKMQGFSADERAAIEAVVRGGSVENIAKFLGKFGLAEGGATNSLMALLGVVFGGGIGHIISGGNPAGAGAGAAIVPVIGQSFKSIAQRLTASNAKFADALNRAGKNAFSIAEAYVRNVPASQRSVEELTGILLQRQVNVQSARMAKNQLLSDAALLASWIQNADLVEPQETKPEVKPESRNLPRPVSAGAVTADRLP